MTCEALGTSPALGEIFWCAIQMAAGSYILAGILVFVLLLYGMYKAGLPIELQFPIGLGFLFVFAGAGIIEFAVDPLFTNLTLIGLILFGMVVFFIFWKLKRGS